MNALHGLVILKKCLHFDHEIALLYIPEPFCSRLHFPDLSRARSLIRRTRSRTEHLAPSFLSAPFTYFAMRKVEAFHCIPIHLRRQESLFSLTLMHFHVVPGRSLSTASSFLTFPFPILVEQIASFPKEERAPYLKLQKEWSIFLSSLSDLLYH